MARLFYVLPFVHREPGLSESLAGPAICVKHIKWSLRLGNPLGRFHHF